GMLATVREYALERLSASGEEEAPRRRQAAYYLALAERAEPHLRGPEQVRWLARLDAEHDDLRAALDWALQPGQAGMALRIGGALHRSWSGQGHKAEGLGWLGRALALDAPVPAGVRARALTGAARLALEGGGGARAAAYLDECLAIWRDLGDSHG